MNRSHLLKLCSCYHDGLFQSTLPFWLRHGLDREHGGLITCLDREGSVVDTDKAVWLQGRATWMFATVYNTVERRAEWLEAARHCRDFILRHCQGPKGKLYFQVTRDGQPLRMRRYAYSESFAAIGCAAVARASGDPQANDDAQRFFAAYLHYSFTPGAVPPKWEPARRMQGLAPHMITIATAQELRENLGDVSVAGRTCSQWIDRSIDAIEESFFKPDFGALMETVGPNGEILDHFDGRLLNPGHSIECAWFILREAKHRARDARLLKLGLSILDAMWARGWDQEFGGLLYFTDLHQKPIQEYWAEMKFWWPHNEAEIATLLAYQLTNDARYARWHSDVHEWSHRVFPDPEHGEWYGYAHRDGRISTRLKGSLWKGPFHLPRMQWYCAQIVDELLRDSAP